MLGALNCFARCALLLVIDTLEAVKGSKGESSILPLIQAACFDYLKIWQHFRNVVLFYARRIL